MTRPLIGITGIRRLGAQVDGVPPNLPDNAVDAYLTDYGNAVRRAGGAVVHLPLDDDPADLIPRIDGLLLTGGEDIDPARYGQEPHESVTVLAPERDRFEFGAFRAAHAAGMPVLGVCRGMQLINVALGGTLHQDIADHRFYDRDPGVQVHGVDCASNSQLSGMFGAARGANSMHHQAIDALGGGISITARSHDGVVEGVEGNNILAVQWHPELLQDHDETPIFAWLVNAAGAFSSVAK